MFVLRACVAVAVAVELKRRMMARPGYYASLLQTPADEKDPTVVQIEKVTMTLRVCDCDLTEC